jgi:hypothetical protein
MLLVVALQTAPANDPHQGQFTQGTGRRCASCHANTPRAEDTYRAAARMKRMMTDLNNGPLARNGAITCFTCHRGGGPNRNLAHPAALNRSAVRATLKEWPITANSAPESLRITMSEYSVSLGVNCQFCHVSTNWKTGTKPQMNATRAMEMLMKEFPKYFDFAIASAFTCFTCHQGATKIVR